MLCVAHKPHICQPNPQPNPHSSRSRLKGSITTTLSNSALRDPVTVLDPSFNPPTLAHHALVLLPVASSPTDARLLLLSVRNADRVPCPGDASPVQRVGMMVCHAYEVDHLVPTVHLTRIIISLPILLEWPTEYDKLKSIVGHAKRMRRVYVYMRYNGL